MSAVVNMLSWVAEKAGRPQPPTQPTRRYDAASAASRLSGWLTPSTDANAAILAPEKIRNRARDLIRNNPWAAKGLTVIVNNTIGFGIRAQLNAGTKTRTRQIQSLWSAWAETTACDADGLHDFYGLQQLATRAMVESGECLIRLRNRRPEDGLPVPLQLQVLEPDYLATELQPAGLGNNLVRDGIEYDALGRRVAYHLYRTHPGAAYTSLSRVDTSITRVPAAEIIHLFRRDRPGQERGVSWFAPVILRLRELGIYEDALLKRQQIANLFAGFITTEEPAAMADELDDELPDLAPGTMYLLKPGRSITFNDPPKVENDPAFRDACLRAVAAGLGITFEALTGNLSEVNFSSARMGAHEMGRNIDAWQWSLIVPRLCNGVLGWFKDGLTATGLNAADLTAEWTPPARTLVDPAKEYKALQTAVRSGFLSLPEAIRAQGFDPDAVLAEQAEYLAKLDAAGVKVESDIRNEITPTVQPVIEDPNA